MRKFLTSIPLTVLLALAAALLVTSCPRTVPLEETSELYRRYAGSEGVEVSFIKDYSLNDSIHVDVTLLVAADSAGWMHLQEGLGYDRLSPEDREYLINHKGIRVKLVPKGHLDRPMDSVYLNNDLVAIDAKDRTIAIFNLTDTIQSSAITKKYLKETKTRKHLNSPFARKARGPQQGITFNNDEKNNMR